MSVLDTLGMVGEILSWIGLGIGAPLLLIALLVRAGDGRWLPVEAVIVTQGDGVLVRWVAAGELRERPLTEPEYADLAHAEGSLPAFVSEKRPTKLRFEARRPVVHELYVVGLTLAIIGAASLGLSFVPMFVG
ncbi:hypothetical protein G7067_02335 [Leucobacter insecticola]|uniref:Sortase n=1 Tax=Leucobacter insecticola TaxID=2714934 RepID=A0A6G8FGL0_9MICO|nr:hypothetical protein [Leucobacter insecticola]QIM15508.1 hypothetical protein G7067_02335 [Leucobacter insecticola]